jgi:hypothetical protein
MKTEVTITLNVADLSLSVTRNGKIKRLAQGSKAFSFYKVLAKRHIVLIRFGNLN